jgi:hypothetical protein
MKLIPGKLYKVKQEILFVGENFRKDENAKNCIKNEGSVVMFLERNTTHEEYVFLEGTQRMVSWQTSVDVVPERFFEEIEL